jgi:hypothetical protein
MNTTRRRSIALLLALAPLGAAHTQSGSPFLYVWSDPGSATKRYSNLPPEWYRTPAQSAEGAQVKGPRIRVYSGAALVDDTFLTPDERKALVPQPAAQKPGAQRPRTAF